MAHLMDIKRVLYRAASGVNAALCRLYFCRHCLKLRSTECVSHEIDSYFCANCLETVAAGEARVKKNRCLTCFDCPSCRHTLSTRASTQLVPSPEAPDKTVPKKVYYLVCGFCRWSTREVGIADQQQASGGWKDKEVSEAKRIQELVDYFQQVATRERLERDKKKFTRRRNYLHFTHGLTTPGLRKRSLLASATAGLKKAESPAPVVQPAEAHELLDELPEEVFTQPLDLSSVTTISQRLAATAHQPDMSDQLYPLRKYMLARRSQRCRECEHNLSKMDFNPSCIKFKIQLVATQFVPEIRIMSVPELKLNQQVNVVLTLTNPVEYSLQCLLLPGLPELCEASVPGTAEVEIAPGELLLARRDDAAEFDDNAEQATQFDDDPNLVVFRKANKIGLLVKVTPKDSEAEEVMLSLYLKHEYRHLSSALPSAEAQQPKVVWMAHPVLLNLGKLMQ